MCSPRTCVNVGVIRPKEDRAHMQSFADSERFIECSERIVLECNRCGEALILLGCKRDWQSERTFFDCHCGQKLTLMDRKGDGALTPEEEHSVRELLRSLALKDTF